MLEFKLEGWAALNRRRTKELSISKRLIGESEDRRLVGDDSLATNHGTKVLKADGYWAFILTEQESHSGVFFKASHAAVSTQCFSPSFLFFFFKRVSCNLGLPRTQYVEGDFEPLILPPPPSPGITDVQHHANLFSTGDRIFKHARQALY